MNKLSLGVVLLGAAFIVGVFLLAALAVMLLTNIVLDHYGAKTLDFASSMAITALATIVSGAAFNGSKEN